MKYLIPWTLYFSMILGLCVMIGCDKATSVQKDEDNQIVYNYSKDALNQPALKTSAITPVTKEQKELAKQYDTPRTVQKVNSPLAVKANPELEMLKKRLKDLKATMKVDQYGNITLLKIAGSGDNEASFNLTDMKNIGRLLVSSLDSIFMEGPVFTDDFIAEMKNLKKLTSITINNSEIRDSSLELFASLPELKTLDIRRNLKLNNDSLKILEKMPKLEELYALYNSFTNSGIAKISKVKTLKVVDVRGCSDVSDTGAKYLARLPLIEELYFRFMITNSGIEYLSAAPTLHFVEFQDCNDINDECVQFFKMFKALTGLRIFRCKGIGDLTIQGIAEMPLSRLELRDLNVSNDGILALKGKNNLKTLELSELTGVDSQGLVTLLETLTSLESLNFFAIPLDDKGMAVIADKMSNLKTLTIRSVRMTDAAIDSLLKLKNLETLDIRENDSFSPQALVRLAELKNLKKLNLGGTKICLRENEKIYAQLKAGLPKCNIAN